MEKLKEHVVQQKMIKKWIEKKVGESEYKWQVYSKDIENKEKFNIQNEKKNK